MAAGVQFPYPRKTSDSSASYPQQRSSPSRFSIKKLASYTLGIAALVWLVLWLFRSPATTSVVAPLGTPPVVIVTTIPPGLSEKHKAIIKENRLDYAKRHGYGTFFPNTTDYELAPGTPSTWSQVPALRHAMTLYPYTEWMWFLSSTALIMDPTKSLYTEILDPRKIESLMIVDRPVVPPDSVIKTFSHLKGERVKFILTQDKDGLADESMLIQTGDWAKFFLDGWYDPLYRSYNFQKAQRHALEHMVQWHGTVLAKMVLIGQRLMNGYAGEAPGAGQDGQYQSGDFVVNCFGCASDPKRSCDEEMAPYVKTWREATKQ
ncbi:putative alpha-1,2-galactosyltransferase C8D2.17 [Acrodontium crateriforme]|uniref:Alpha-1,2-galactosyltransferase C8D2.17 n=1 Tax=Acrodontium crateriforme TaxID=150365 RepID=A0AAQ3MDL0_9PEZI|nr:putative alpha-1,2-galactosyltransferase C8D2.17 [Acrodontium crateriforme]